MKHDPVLGLELVLRHYQEQLKSNIPDTEKYHYGKMYMDNYHELYYLDREKSKPFMEWWVRYAR